MSAGTSIWDKLTRVVIVLFVIAILLGIGIWYLPLIRQNERMREEVLKLDDQIQKEQETHKQTTTSIDAMHNDPGTVEREAREKLGYAKPGETVVRFRSTRDEPAGQPVKPRERAAHTVMISFSLWVTCWSTLAV